MCWRRSFHRPAALKNLSPNIGAALSLVLSRYLVKLERHIHVECAEVYGGEFDQCWHLCLSGRRRHDLGGTISKTCRLSKGASCATLSAVFCPTVNSC